MTRRGYIVARRHDDIEMASMPLLADNGGVLRQKHQESRRLSQQVHGEFGTLAFFALHQYRSAVTRHQCVADR